MFLADLSWSVGNLSCYSMLDLWKNANKRIYSELKVISLLYYIFMWWSYTRHDLAGYPVKIELSISVLIKTGTKYKMLTEYFMIIPKTWLLFHFRLVQIQTCESKTAESVLSWICWLLLPTFITVNIKTFPRSLLKPHGDEVRSHTSWYWAVAESQRRRHRPDPIIAPFCQPIIFLPHAPLSLFSPTLPSPLSGCYLQLLMP